MWGWTWIIKQRIEQHNWGGEGQMVESSIFIYDNELSNRKKHKKNIIFELLSPPIYLMTWQHINKWKLNKTLHMFYFSPRSVWVNIENINVCSVCQSLLSVHKFIYLFLCFSYNFFVCLFAYYAAFYARLLAFAVDNLTTKMMK